MCTVQRCIAVIGVMKSRMVNSWAGTGGTSGQKGLWEEGRQSHQPDTAGCTRGEIRASSHVTEANLSYKN